MTGCILVLEGLDGTGKTTAAERIAARTGGVLLSTPDFTLKEHRDAVDNLYEDAPDAEHLFYASCVAYASAQARHYVALGQKVVIDRYWLSTWAYSVVRKTSLELSEVEKRLCPAHVTVLLTLDEEERQKRLRTRTMTAADRRVSERDAAILVEQRYRKGLLRPIAGRAEVMDVTHKTPDEVTTELLALLTSCPTVASAAPDAF